MLLEYYRHVLKTRMHEHFPDFERVQKTLFEADKNFTAVLQEWHPTLKLSDDDLKRMKSDFTEYLNRRSGSFKSKINTCNGTLGRWSKKRSQRPILEFDYTCYDSIYYKNWSTLPILDRLVWSNITVVAITNAYCPYSSNDGIIFIID